ncbi:putative sortase-sorted surface anchored protein (pseudogene) [Streptococcus pneumoniae]|nr:putative sortase-sorted surface anchored protein (pseudogene) [Streptococcus pneumoniae]
MNHPEKQLKYSIRKVSVGAASVVIGALYLLMGAGIAHADGMESAREAERTSSPADPEQSGTGETGNKPDLNNPDAVASTYNAPVAENPLVAPGNAKPRTRGKRALPDGETGGTSNGTTGTESGDNQPTSEDSPALDANRKGDTVKEHQPGVVVPKDGEEGADDKNANLRFDTPKENLTLEELWDIVKNMPDDFQNNERSYLRNMNTLGDALNLKPGEIRELHDFGGWHAIDKDGTKGKFVIGRKNEQGYFTGWRMKEDGTIEQGGMLGGDALDNIYVHEQALDRRFRYMLMLVKGRTRANRDETVSDKSEYDPRAQNERADSAGTPYKNLPFLEKDTYDKYSPGVVGYNGIEKQFTAFSPKFGSRVRVEFVTGYISDVNGSKGTYRVVIKTKNTAGQENTVYDQTIHRVAEIVQNEDLYKKGLNVEQANSQIMKFFKDEFHYRVIQIRNEKVKNSSLNRVNKNKYTEAQKELYNKLDAEATEEAKKQGDIVMNVDKDFMSISKSNKAGSDWKKTFTKGSSASLANTLNNLLKEVEKDTPDTPTWLNSSTSPAQADDRTYKLMNVLIPGAKKITYHVNDDQLEVETEKYSYLAARNGSKEVGIQGSDVAATGTANDYNANPDKFELINTNTKVNERNGGWAKSSSGDFQEFSRFIGVDKGIVRTNVISDKDLSDKIRAAVGPGDSNLGKGGYFSTGDVLLGTDVVSYTVQVFSENNERVGVNPQSHRVQYNLPILADFSVIQDTVEPSRNVVEKIIPKLNIPEEDKKKITEKIKEKKKTSELADLISGNVKVRYVDEQGKLLSLKNDTGIGEKESDGTYITNKKQLIGTSYDVTDKQLSSMTTTDGKYYTFKEADTNSASLTGNIVSEGRTVTLVYRESEAPAATGSVTVTYKDTENKTIEGYETPKNVVTDAPTGTQFNTATDEYKLGKITTASGKIYKLVSEKTEGTETGTVTEGTHNVTYVYELVKGDVTVKYENEAGDTIETAKEVAKDVATGTAYDTTTAEIKKDRIQTADGKVYKLKEVKAGSAAETGKVSDTPAVITYVYTLANGNVTVHYENEAGDTIETAKEVAKDVATGTAYDTTTAEIKKDRIQTADGKVYKLKEVKAGSAAETGKVSDTPAVITYVYELVKTPDNSTPDKPTPEKPETPSPQEPGTPGVPTPEEPNPQPNPEHPSVPTPSPELPNQETPIPEPIPEPGTSSPETPVRPDPEVPTDETGKREELPNTGTEANTGLAGAGLLTLLAGLGLGFFKKKEDESE